MVGYGPKMFQSIVRFQRLINLADRKSGLYNTAWPTWLLKQAMPIKRT
jgi:hypothetical protein